MKYHLRVYDNFHYNDESEAYDQGLYNSYDHALEAAKGVVDEFLIFNWRKGMLSNDLHVLFLMYGDDPIIVPNDRNEPLDLPRFDARDYVVEIIEEFCKKLEEQ